VKFQLLLLQKREQAILNPIIYSKYTFLDCYSIFSALHVYFLPTDGHGEVSILEKLYWKGELMWYFKYCAPNYLPYYIIWNFHVKWCAPQLTTLLWIAILDWHKAMLICQNLPHHGQAHTLILIKPQITWMFSTSQSTLIQLNQINVEFQNNLHHIKSPFQCTLCQINQWIKLTGCSLSQGIQFVSSLSKKNTILQRGMVEFFANLYDERHFSNCLSIWCPTSGVFMASNTLGRLRWDPVCNFRESSWP
jgi:hypothetical protein